MAPRPTAAPGAEYPILDATSEAEWRDWLHANHASAGGVWLRMARKGSERRSPSYDEALDVALCYGWIDGQSRGEDETSWLQKYTPRGRRSVWSKRNREHVERLIATGRMQPAGIAAVEAARADGRWERAYDSPATAVVPDDLREALDASPPAAELFAGLKSQSRFAILHAVQTAVRPETRARRIAKFVDMLRRGESP